MFARTWLLITIAAVSGCGVSMAPPATSRSVPNAAADPVARFRSLHPGMTMEEVRAQLGRPARETGSGLAIDVYRLADGSEVWLGYAGVKGLSYVRHGDDDLLPTSR